MTVNQAQHATLACLGQIFYASTFGQVSGTFCMIVKMHITSVQFKQIPICMADIRNQRKITTSFKWSLDYIWKKFGCPSLATPRNVVQHSDLQIWSNNLEYIKTLFFSAMLDECEYAN